MNINAVSESDFGVFHISEIIWNYHKPNAHLVHLTDRPQTVEGMNQNPGPYNTLAIMIGNGSFAIISEALQRRTPKKRARTKKRVRK